MAFGHDLCKFIALNATNLIMKSIINFILLLLITTSVGVAQQINWVSFEEALELQKKNPKKIMMDVYTVWCGPCKMLDKNTFANKDVADFVNKHYYAVKFDAQGNSTEKYMGKTFTNPNYDPAKAKTRNGTHQLTMFLKVNAFPTIVFFDEGGEYITPVRGYQSPQQLELYLKLFQSDKHKEMSSQEDFNTYYSNFKPSFSGK